MFEIFKWIEIKKLPYFYSWLSLGLLIISISAPIFTSATSQLISSYDTDWLAIFAMTLSSISLLISPINRLYLPAISLLPMLLLVIILVQCFLLPQVMPEKAVFYIIYLLFTAVVMTIAHNLVWQLGLAQIVKWLALAIGAAAVIIVLRELWYFLDQRLYGKWGGFYQPNMYADYLSLGLVSCLFLPNLLQQKSGKLYLACICCSLLIAAGLSLCSSRSIWIYFILLAVLSGIKPLYKYQLYVVLGIFGIFIVLQPVWSLLIQSNMVQSSAARTLELASSPKSIRLHLWNIAWQLFKASPWLGQGIGQFDWAYYLAGNGIPEHYVRPDHTHNLLIQLLTETGVFSALVLLACLGSWLNRLRKVAFTSEHWWLSGLLLILGWHSMVEFPLWFAHFLAIAGLALGIGEQKSFSINFRPAIRLAAVLMLVAALLSAVHQREQYQVMEATLEDLQQHRGNIATASNKLRAVANSEPLFIPYITEIFAFAGNDYGPTINPKMLQIGYQAMQFATFPQLIVKQIVRLAVSGRQQEALAMQQQFLKAFPSGTADLKAEISAYPPESQLRINFLLQAIPQAN